MHEQSTNHISSKNRPRCTVIQNYQFKLYLFPFEANHLVEAVEFITAEASIFLLGVFMESFEDTHHLPLRCEGVCVCVCGAGGGGGGGGEYAGILNREVGNTICDSPV